MSSFCRSCSANPTWSACACVSTIAFTSGNVRPSSRRPGPSCVRYPGSAASTTVTPSSSASRYQLTIGDPRRTTLSLIRVRTGLATSLPVAGPGGRETSVFDRAPDAERREHVRLDQLPVLGIGLHARAVDRLAEEAARGCGKHDVEDLVVAQPEAAQAVVICLGDRGRIGRDLAREILDRLLLRTQGVARPEPELLDEHLPVGGRAVARPQLLRGRDRGELVPAQVHLPSDRAVQLLPRLVDRRPSREEAVVVRHVAERCAGGGGGLPRGARGGGPPPSPPP